MTGLGHGWHGGVLTMLPMPASVYVLYIHFIVNIEQGFILPGANIDRVR